LANGQNGKWLSAICEGIGGRTGVHPESEFNRRAEPAFPSAICTIHQETKLKYASIGAAAVAAAAAFASPAMRIFSAIGILTNTQGKQL
jgi:hypothetical protein